jgi:hypothetical protein
MDFAGMIQTWIRVLSGPKEETFEQEQASPNATLSTALIWTVIAAVAAAIFGFIQSLIFASSAQGMLGMISQMVNQMMGAGLFAGAGGAGAFAGIIITPIAFLIGVGIIHLIANLLGGRGDFGRFAYLAAAIQAPVSIISSLLGFIPVLGGCVALLISIYSIVLEYFAIKVSYKLTSGRAIAVIAIPLIAAFLLAMCVAFAIAAIGISLNN